jgi:hypothetical protein
MVTYAHRLPSAVLAGVSSSHNLTGRFGGRIFCHQRCLGSATPARKSPKEEAKGLVCYLGYNVGNIPLDHDAGR